MYKKAEQLSGPDYKSLANEIQTTAAQNTEARRGLLPVKDGGKMLPQDLAEEARFDKLAKEECAGKEGDYHVVRSRIVREQSVVEKANEATRQAARDVSQALLVAVNNFTRALRADLTNAFAPEALDRIDRYGGDIDKTAQLMVDLAPTLASAPKLKGDEPRPPREQAAPRKAFSPASDY